MSAILSMEELEKALGSASVCIIEASGMGIEIEPNNTEKSFYLINQEGHHNKFYELYLGKIIGPDYYVVVGRYGRIGGTPRIFVGKYMQNYNAVEALRTKFNTKINKGYQQEYSLGAYINLTNAKHLKK